MNHKHNSTLGEGEAIAFTTRNFPYAYAILRRKTRSAKKNVVSVFVRAGTRNEMIDISQDVADMLGLAYEPTFKGVITKLSPVELVEEFARAVWGDSSHLHVQVL